MRTCFFTILSLCVVSIFVGCRQQELPTYTRGGYDLNRPRTAGYNGPGPGVVSTNAHTGNYAGNTAGMINPQLAPQQGPQTTQVEFVGPLNAKISWDVSAQGMFDSGAQMLPVRQDFPWGGIFRLKLEEIPGHSTTVLYPTLEIAPGMPRTQAFLAHSTVPVNFTEEDIMQVLSGNFVTKVIYLPDPEFQEIALAVGTPDTLVSTRLDPGVDPIKEADRRGSILAIIRLGNKKIDAMEGQYQEVIGPDGNVMNAGGGMVGGTTPSNYISGVTGPQYGTPITPTAHGYPGPVELPTGEKARRMGTYNNR
ncbi:MAG: hypothetical protein Q4C96_04820 [Planctomycetia bacterium]|nr:hypothetical protein [Planctomycetia bacterium]